MAIILKFCYNWIFFLCFKFFFYATDFDGFVTKVLSVLNIKRKKFISKFPHYFAQGKLLALHYDMWDSKELRNLDWSFREELYWISNFLFYATNIVYNQGIVTKKTHQNLNIWQYTSVNILLLFHYRIYIKKCTSNRVLNLHYYSFLIFIISNQTLYQILRDIKHLNSV